jgi:hypothetical protein
MFTLQSFHYVKVYGRIWIYMILFEEADSQF